MSNLMVPDGVGVLQIMKILGIADMSVIEFTLTVVMGEFPTLTILTNPKESNHVGFAAKHFTLTEIHHDEIV